MAFKFEKLEVWKEAVRLTSKVYKVTADFPKEEIFGLTNQLRRASVSAGLNIAEGSTGRTNKDFRSYLLRLLGSVHEVITGLYIALEQNYLKTETFEELYSDYDQLSKRANALIKSFNNKLSTVDGGRRTK